MRIWGKADTVCGDVVVCLWKQTFEVVAVFGLGTSFHFLVSVYKRMFSLFSHIDIQTICYVAGKQVVCFLL